MRVVDGVAAEIIWSRVLILSTKSRYVGRNPGPIVVSYDVSFVKIGIIDFASEQYEGTTRLFLVVVFNDENILHE